MTTQFCRKKTQTMAYFDFKNAGDKYLKSGLYAQAIESYSQALALPITTAGLTHATPPSIPSLAATTHNPETVNPPAERAQTEQHRQDHVLFGNRRYHAMFCYFEFFLCVTVHPVSRLQSMLPRSW